MKIARIILGLAALFAVSSAQAETKSLADVWATQQSISKQEASDEINSLFNSIEKELAQGNVVQVRNYGKFFAQDRKARKAKNPRTGEDVDVPPKRYPKFSSSKTFKDRLNNKN